MRITKSAFGAVVATCALLLTPMVAHATTGDELSMTLPRTVGEAPGNTGGDSDTPDSEEPGTETPGTDTPGTDTPDTETPGAENPDEDGPGDAGSGDDGTGGGGSGEEGDGGEAGAGETENPDGEPGDSDTPGAIPTGAAPVAHCGVLTAGPGEVNEAMEGFRALKITNVELQASASGPVLSFDYAVTPGKTYGYFQVSAPNSGPSIEAHQELTGSGTKSVPVSASLTEFELATWFATPGPGGGVFPIRDASFTVTGNACTTGAETGTGGETGGTGGSPGANGPTLTLGTGTGATAQKSGALAATGAGSFLAPAGLGALLVAAGAAAAFGRRLKRADGS